ncbi:hypothetical protein [Suttonella ornithocola]|uniref:Uncharacterized protein n=1 Tax=Suttonella ornithocola TaxID=279832 RepID=A0A380MZ63_9GAMM|nr:hypothetical protein [Suttonella ornithocola]SUO96757.1 Uncharacterised protein [Suttonella ornithocola]
MDTSVISPLKVLHSAAGYYVGRTSCEEVCDGIIAEIPYSRESGYFRTKKQAEVCLFNDFICNPSIKPSGFVKECINGPFFEEAE